MVHSKMHGLDMCCNSAKQENSQSTWLKLIIIVSWTIWSEKYDLQFQHKQANPKTVASKAFSFATYIDKLYDKQYLKTPTMNHHPPHRHWKPPAYPLFTINCDASYDETTKLTGIALILRDFAGQGRGSYAKCYRGVTDSEHGECLAFSEAVKWSKELQYTHVVLETDLKGIESYISKKAPVIAWETEDILRDAINSLRSIPHWECCFIHGTCNKPAYKL